MDTPINRTFNIPSGGTALVGRTTAIGGGSVPSWAAAAPLNAWTEIPGTSGAGGTPIESFSGWAALPSGKLAIAAAGGHTDGTKNSVAVIDLLQNAPAWVEVSPQSPTHTYEVAYEDDGKPTSCHTYYTEFYHAQLQRLIRVGAYAVSLSGNTHYPTVDTFNLATNTWDAAGTNRSVPSAGNLGVAINPNNGDVLTQGGLLVYRATQSTNLDVAQNGIDSGQFPRAPYVWDSSRNCFFGMCYGDNQQASLFLGTLGLRINWSGGIYGAQKITFAPSTGLTQFEADVPLYMGMTYDPINDFYLAYFGARAGTAGRVYKITPNSTSVWNIDVFAQGSGGITPVQNVASGVMNKFTYVPELKGVVMMATKATNLYFLRTA